MPASKHKLHETDPTLLVRDGNSKKHRSSKLTLNVMEFKEDLPSIDSSHGTVVHGNSSSNAVTANAVNNNGVRPDVGSRPDLEDELIEDQIKPFKYVGDRSLLQTRKWEIIQQQYATHELRTGLVVPTVRTLQRHLANAIKLCLTKIENGESARDTLPGNNSESTNNMFETSPGGGTEMDLIQRVALSVRPTSSISDLEWAIFRLTELSERLRNGSIPEAFPRLGQDASIQLHQASPTTVAAAAAAAAAAATTPRIDDAIGVIDGELTNTNGFSSALTKSSAEMASNSFKLFTHLIERLRSAIDLSETSDLTARPVLDGILRKMTELHNHVSVHNARIRQQADILVKQFQEDLKRMIDNNNENLHAQTCLMQGMVLSFYRH